MGGAVGRGATGGKLVVGTHGGPFRSSHSIPGTIGRLGNVHRAHRRKPATRVEGLPRHPASKVGAILEDFLLFKLTRAASLLIEVLGGEIARVRFLDRRSFDDHLLELVHRDGLLLLAHLRLGHLLEEVKRCQS